MSVAVMSVTWQIALVSTLAFIVPILVLFFATLFLSKVWQARQDARVWDGPKCVRCGRSVDHADGDHGCPVAEPPAPWWMNVASFFSGAIDWFALLPFWGRFWIAAGVATAVLWPLHMVGVV